MTNISDKLKVLFLFIGTYSLSYSVKSTLIVSLDRTGLPWGLEHHWGHSCQCRSLFQRLEQGWDKSGHRPFCITGGGQPTWRPHCQDEVPEDVLRQADCCQWGSHSALHCSEGVRFRETVVVENYGPLPNDRLKIDLYDTVLYIWYYESISAVQMSQMHCLPKKHKAVCSIVFSSSHLGVWHSIVLCCTVQYKMSKKWVKAFDKETKGERCACGIVGRCARHFVLTAIPCHPRFEQL